MTRVDMVTLIGGNALSKSALSKDAIGQPVPQPDTRKVICTVLSVSRAEWIAASQRSLAPSLVVKVFFADYDGETVAELNGKQYEIYRTYQNGDYVELYLGRKVGV